MSEISKNRSQTVISYLLIFLLILAAIAIGIKQQFYEKSVLGDTILSDGLFGANFAPAGDAETYNSDNLYEKIDGKADLYLNNGFVSLQCRRFVDKSKKDSWAEVYLYDMSNGENAFAVYSLQKRSENKPLGWTQFGYSTSDSVYTALGKYYVEIVLSSEDKTLLVSAQNAAKNLSSIISAGKTEIPFLNLFPTENLVADSFKYIKADAFGCSDLENIFTADYKINSNNITAYLTKNRPADTFAKYHRFLIDNGGKELQHNIKLQDCKAVELFGTNEIFFSTDGFLAGARGSATIEDLQQTAVKLLNNLSEKK